MRLLASLMLAVTLLFGSVAQATLLDQVNSAAPGTWVKVITENTATSINPDPQGTTTYRGNTGFLSVWEAWNSGVYVPTYGTCGAMIYYGGGHVDYYGNEVVAFDFCGDSGLPKWRLVTQPYAGSITFPTTNGTFADGTPSPSHNYDGIEYDPKTNNIWVSETQLNNLTATVTEKAMMFNVTSKTWSGPYAHRGALEGFTAWDTTRQLLWFMPEKGRAGELTSVNTSTTPPTLTYYGVISSPYLSANLDSIMSYNPDIDSLVLTTFRSASFWMEHSLSLTNNVWTPMTQIGQPITLGAQNTLDWSPNRHAHVLWMDLLNDGKVWEVKHTNSTTVTWTNLTAVTNTVIPTTVAHTGSYKKFRLVNIGGSEILIGQLRLVDGVYFFKLPGGIYVPPPPPTDVTLPVCISQTNKTAVQSLLNSFIACPATLPAGTTIPQCINQTYKDQLQTPLTPMTVCPPTVSTFDPASPMSKALADYCISASGMVCEDFNVKLNKGILYKGFAMPKLSGGLLAFNIPSLSGADAGGKYTVNFPKPIGQGSFVALSYRVKADTGAIALPGRKQFTMWRGSAPCTDLEVTITHRYVGQLITPYTECGAHTFEKLIGTTDFQQQYPDYDCQYARNSHRGDFSTCLTSVADRWDTYYIEITVGTYGVANSKAVMWQKSDKGVWKRFIDTSTFTFNGSGGFGSLMLTVYMTGKDATISHPEGNVWFDNLVIGTTPFKALLP